MSCCPWIIPTIPPEERPDRRHGAAGQAGNGRFSTPLPPSFRAANNKALPLPRALANDPPIIVADEPTGTSTHAQPTVFSLFGDLVSDGKTVLMVTHDRDLANRTGALSPWLTG
jgi:ABC-type lipoprotein export system ATPase subunit